MLSHSVRSNSLRCHGQAPLSMEFSRQEYWVSCHILTPGFLPNPGIKPISPALASGLFTAEPPGKPDSVTGSSVYDINVYSISELIFISLKRSALTTLMQASAQSTPT